jgi:uncharacterized protein (DUF4415 family)
MPKKEKHTAVRELDLERPARLTRRQKTDLAALAAMPDDKIDYSDIPSTTLKSWEQGVRRGFYKPVKRQLTVRVDADVLAWLKSKGAGYHSRLNRILRSAMLRDSKS